jgi:hypothetical protein
MAEGHKKISWNARDNGGNSISSGAHFFRPEASDFVEERKAVLRH